MSRSFAIVRIAWAVIGLAGWSSTAAAPPRSSAEIAASHESNRQVPPVAAPAVEAGQQAAEGAAEPPTQTPVAGDVRHDRPAPSGQDALRAAFRRMDRDGDGRITLREYLAWSRARFNGLDRDRNYHLSAQERQRGVQTFGGPSAVEAVGTAELSIDQDARQAEAEFRGADADGDGGLLLSELQAAAAPPPAVQGF